MNDTAKPGPILSAIVPARNEEATIGACVESLTQQQEIKEILVVDDQSTDRTAQIVYDLMNQYSQIRLLQTTDLPPEWVGKNHAVWLGAREAKGDWLLFTDADVLHGAKSASNGMEIARKQNASLVSFSPEQITETWYEKSLIPVIYCRLASKFSYDDVNNPQKADAAANGQFLLINRETYNSVGGHAAIFGEVLEDVALAKLVKEAGYRLWFGSGAGIVRVRMYRSFAGMWEGWRKNLYRLMAGSLAAVISEIARAIAPLLVLAILVSLSWGMVPGLQSFALRAVIALGLWHWFYRRELAHNQFPLKLIWYGIPGKLLYSGVLWASYRSHQNGSLVWKGREYPVGTSDASKS